VFIPVVVVSATRLPGVGHRQGLRQLRGARRVAAHYWCVCIYIYIYIYIYISYVIRAMLSDYCLRLATASSHAWSLRGVEFEGLRSRSRCCFPLRRALGLFKSPRGWAHVSLLAFRELAEQGLLRFGQALGDVSFLLLYMMGLLFVHLGEDVRNPQIATFFRSCGVAAAPSSGMQNALMPSQGSGLPRPTSCDPHWVNPHSMLIIEVT